MHISMKFSISLLFLLSCAIYQSHASIDVEAAPINDTDEDCICGRIYSPLCASDLKTYNNPCLFECAQKKWRSRGRSLALVRQGTCADEELGRTHETTDERVAVEAVADEDEDLAHCACDRSFTPLCASDNRTYSNRCLFDCKRSIRARLGKVLTLLRMGACN